MDRLAAGEEERHAANANDVIEAMTRCISIRPSAAWRNLVGEPLGVKIGASSSRLITQMFWLNAAP